MGFIEIVPFGENHLDSAASVGVQFHPEFDAEITRTYTQHCRQELIAEGQDVDGLLAACHDTAWGHMILKRFAAIVGFSFSA